MQTILRQSGSPCKAKSKDPDFEIKGSSADPKDGKWPRRMRLFIGPSPRLCSRKYKKVKPTNKEKMSKRYGSKDHILTTDELGNGNVETVNHVGTKLCSDEHGYGSES